MQYLLLIYGNETEAAKASDAARGAMFEEYFAFNAAVREAGVFVGGEPLQDTSTATTVRVREGEPLHTDGPFAETREQLGGYYLLDVPDLDAALSWAARLPGAKYGSVEVRPLMVLEGRDG